MVNASATKLLVITKVNIIIIVSCKQVYVAIVCNVHACACALSTTT